MENGSTLPELTLKTNAILESVAIKSDITKLIEKLNLNNALGFDNIPIAMLKIYSFGVVLPLQIIFQRF